VKVPTEEKIDLIISTASLRYSTIFHLSKHGLRPIEISKVTLRARSLTSQIWSGFFVNSETK
jgi:hypothetical protein